MVNDKQNNAQREGYSVTFDLLWSYSEFGEIWSLWVPFVGLVFG